MRLVIQRVSQASVLIDQNAHAAIKNGLIVLIGVENNDSTSDADYLAAKCIGLRVFDDENGKMNLSVGDISGEILIVSQFTPTRCYKKREQAELHKSRKTRKGHSFI